ncbi:MAG: hypothetical protein CMG75_08085 [Candidatus Marinimicrobia bacterium]|nr:hypothetical protein [Candidatus Neomarinimicrobiota bacterium]|tara:strand:- start:7371 stop:8408 length:1038 start_codon:yes stop_codon:yes gene_type:complete
MIYKYVLLAIFISTSFYSNYLKAESIWVKYGNQIFRGVGDAKAIGLSESGVAAATGPLSIIWNPARLNSVDERSFIFAHQERFAGSVTFDIFGIDLQQRSESNWSLVLIREAVQGIPKTTDALLFGTGSLDDPEERVLSSNVTFFNQSQWAGVIGFATSRGEWNLGGNTKVLIHQLGEFSGWGIGFDVGGWKRLSTNNVIGISIRDITTSWVIWDSGTVERISPELRLGDAHSFNFDVFPLKVTTMGTIVLSMEGKKKNDDFFIGSFGSHYRLGLELNYNNKLNIRCGRNPISGFSTGLGFIFNFGEIDYAFVPSPLGTILGSSHYVSLNLKLEAIDSFFGILKK